MSSSILNRLLYDHNVKKIANFLLNNQFFLLNPVYRYFLQKRIQQVIKLYRIKPFSLRIENTNVCNSRCFMCPHSIMKRKQGFMEKELYQKIVDEAVEMGINFINLHNFGEPLLDKDFPWRVKYAKQKGIKRITTNTNAQTMDEKVSRQLIESGLDEIFVSLDAASEKVYQRLRVGLDFKKVVANVKGLVELKRKLKVSNPKVIVDFLKSDINCHEVKAFTDEWERVVDSVCISSIHDWSAKKEGLANFDYQNYISFSKVPCRLPFTEMLINWDGTISLCCQDVEGEVVVGDAKKNSLKSIWQGKKLNQIRERHLSLNVNSLPLCQNCKVRTFWWMF